MTTHEFNAPTLATAGDLCPGCDSVLAPDQRYCLRCGARRGDARLPFRTVLAEPPGGRVVERVISDVAPPAEPRTGLTFLAGLACLLLALGVGVLIGRTGDTAPATAQAPQVIQVGGAAATTPTSTDGAAATPSETKKSKKATKAKKAKKGSSVPTAKSAKDSKATNKSLQTLGNLSGKDYQKKAAKLPKVVGTGGKAPPVDKSKPAGGGSAVQDIG